MSFLAIKSNHYGGRKKSMIIQNKVFSIPTNKYVDALIMFNIFMIKEVYFLI